jgi:hypothetical protein
MLSYPMTNWRDSDCDDSYSLFAPVIIGPTVA